MTGNCHIFAIGSLLSVKVSMASGQYFNFCTSGLVGSDVIVLF